MANVLHELLHLARPLVVLDTETTGTFPARDRIVELAMIKIHPGGRREIYERRVNPTVPIPPETTKVHGITDADVAGCPKFPEIAAEVAAFLSGCDLAGYNIEGFDLPILQVELGRAGIELDVEGRAIVDAQQIFFREEPRTLSQAMRFYVGEEHVNAHGARPDAEATARVLEGQLRRYAHLPRDPETIAQLYAPSRGRRADPEGKILVKDGQPFVNFGRHRGKSFDQVRNEEPAYFQWILNGGFSEPVKKFVRAYLARGAAPSSP